MSRPSKVKAGALFAPALIGAAFVTSVCIGTIIEFAYPFGMNGGLAETFTVIAMVVAATILPVLASIAFFCAIVDHFPFGRYRLRLVPEDDPTPEAIQ